MLAVGFSWNCVVSVGGIMISSCTMTMAVGRLTDCNGRSIVHSDPTTSNTLQLPWPTDMQGADWKSGTFSFN